MGGGGEGRRYGLQVSSARDESLLYGAMCSIIVRRYEVFTQSHKGIRYGGKYLRKWDRRFVGYRGYKLARKKGNPFPDRKVEAY